MSRSVGPTRVQIIGKAQTQKLKYHSTRHIFLSDLPNLHVKAMWKTAVCGLSYILWTSCDNSAVV